MRKSNATPTDGLKRWIGVAIALFISFQSISQIYTVDSIMRNGRRSNRINLAYLSDGFQNADLPVFIFLVTALNQNLFSKIPFIQYKDYFNAYAIRVPSAETGAKHPGSAADEASSGGQPVADPDNNFQSTFDFNSIHRLLVPQNALAIYAVLANNLPDYGLTFILVNSPYYGGSGGSIFATASTESNSQEIAFHEIGHTFANLADEYWAGDGFAGEKANMTANSDPATVKWKNWIGINGIGVYPYGTSGTAANWYRPHQNCKMQFLGSPFCSVCIEKFIDVIHQKINMIDVNTPVATSFTLSNTNPVQFSITAIQNNPSTIGIKWYLNGSATSFATNQYAVTVPFTSFNNGNNTVRAEIADTTALSKSYLPAAGYVNILSWTVNNTVALPVHLISFSGRENNNTAILNWEIDTPGDLQTFELEKSRDGISFSRLVTVAGQASQKNYSYTDEKLFAPYAYYRLKTTEKSGSVNYSNAIRIQNAFDKFYYKVYQDAAIHQYHLSVRLSDPKKISFTVTDVSGKTIVKKDLGKVDKQAEYNFDLAGRPAGIYFMSLHLNEFTYTIQLLAQ